MGNYSYTVPAEGAVTINPVQQQTTVGKSTYEILMLDILRKYGGEPEVKGNDIYLGGKKVGGIECTAGDTVTFGLCFTLEYLPDRPLFEKYLEKWGDYEITGITEEIPALTREVLIRESVVMKHKDFNATDCLGKYFPFDEMLK